jgi:hypothetical protein
MVNNDIESGPINKFPFLARNFIVLFDLTQT